MHDIITKLLCGVNLQVAPSWLSRLRYDTKLELVPDCYRVCFWVTAFTKGRVRDKRHSPFLCSTSVLARSSYIIGGNHVGLRRQSISEISPISLFSIFSPLPSWFCALSTRLLAGLRSVRKLLQV